ncbi:MAG: Ig-like domain-containing protein [Pseudomonadota bacterium]
MRKTPLLATLTLTLAACGGGGGGGTPPPPANRAPAANDVSALTPPATAVSGTLSATDADGDALTFSVATTPANGNVTLSGTGDRDFEYTPNGGFAGVDTFTFSASDGSLTSNTATVTITVNTAPVVNVPTATLETSDLGTATGTVSGSDVEGDLLTFQVATPPTKGTVTSLDTTSGDFVYTPAVGEDGIDTFTVVAQDAAEPSAPGTITIEIFGWIGPQQIGSSSEDLLATNALLLTDDGGLQQGGVTQGQVGSTPNAGARDVFLRTTDRRGNELSLTQFGGTSDDVIRGMHARPQGDGYYLVVSGPDDNIYRFNNDGTEVFSVPLPVGPGITLLIGNLYWSGIDDAGDLIILSWVDPADPTVVTSGLVTKLSGTNGGLIWQRELLTSIEDNVDFFIDDTNRISPRGVDVDAVGNPVIVGEYWDTAGNRPCERCGFIAKLDAATGDNVWVQEPDAFASCGIDGSGRLYRVTVADDDSLYVNGLANFSQFPSTDGLVARYSADGTQELWQFCDNSGADTTSFFTNPLILADGSIVNYGSVGDANSPPDPSGGGPTASDLVLYKFTDTGAITWSQTIDVVRQDASDADALAGGMVEDAQGILYITGSTDGEVGATANAGDLDAFVLRLGPDGSVQ